MISKVEQSILGYLPASLIKVIIDTKIKIPMEFEFETVSLYANIAHFNIFTEKYNNKGRFSPEYLQFCLNRYFEQLISIIQTNGGDIVKFAGDSIIVVWPKDYSENSDKHNFLLKSSKRAIQCAIDIQKKMKDGFKVKIGVGVGSCEIHIIGGVLDRYEYLYLGDAIDQALKCEEVAEGGNIVISSDVYNYVKNFYALERKNGFYFVDLNVCNRIKSKANANLLRKGFGRDEILRVGSILKQFIPVGVLRYLNKGDEKWSKEIRLLTIMFIKIDVKKNELQDTITVIQKCIYVSEGSLNKFVTDDNGLFVLVVWGLAPLSSLNDSVKSVRAAIKIRESLKCKCHFGISTGTVFSGVCGTMGNRREYSLIGDRVNLGAKCMEIASEGDVDIILDECTMKSLMGKIDCVLYKSITQNQLSSDEVKLYKLSTETKPKSYMDNFYCDYGNWEMIGNTGKLNRFSDILAEDTSTNRLIDVYGYVGVGKSFFIQKGIELYYNSHREIKKSFQEKNLDFIFFTNANGLNVNKSYNGIREIMKKVYHLLVENTNDENKRMYQIYHGRTLYNCDAIGEMIIKQNCLSYLSQLNDIMHTTLESHFEFIPYMQKDILIVNYDSINIFLYEILSLYQKLISPLPLIIIIDNSQMIDENTFSFISQALDKSNKIIFITTFQQPPFTVNEFISISELIFNDNIYVIKLKPISKRSKILTLIRRVREYKSLKNVSSKVLSFLIEKSKGIPLFLIELIKSIDVYYDKDNSYLIETQEFERMIEMDDYTQMNIPVSIEKYIGSIVDTLTVKDMIYLKLASVIGNIFDSKNLKNLIKTQCNENLSNNSIKVLLNNFYEKQIIDYLFVERKLIVAVFVIPFIREILYNRMLLDQKSQCHFEIVKMITNQVSIVDYINNEEKIKKNLLNHLKMSDMTISSLFDGSKVMIAHSFPSFSLMYNISLNIKNRKTIFHSGKVDKKSDGKLTWETRYFVLTSTEIFYYYNENHFESNSQPLGSFNISDIISSCEYRSTSRKFAFRVRVSTWIKKGETMDERTYYLSVENRDDMVQWLIVIQMMKLKVQYDNYCYKYGFVSFPIFTAKDAERRSKKFYFSIEDTIKKNKSINQIKQKFSSKINRESSEIFINIFKRNSRMLSSSDERLYKKLITFCFPIFLSNIQSNVSKTKLVLNSSDIEQTIKIYSVDYMQSSISKMVNEMNDYVRQKKNETDKEDFYSKQQLEYLEKFYEINKRERENSRMMRIGNLYGFGSEEIQRIGTGDFSNKSFRNCADAEVGSFNDKGEEKIDNEDYLKYSCYVEEESEEENEEINDKEEKNEEIEESDEYEGLKPNEKVERLNIERKRRRLIEEDEERKMSQKEKEEDEESSEGFDSNKDPSPKENKKSKHQVHFEFDSTKTLNANKDNDDDGAYQSSKDSIEYRRNEEYKNEKKKETEDEEEIKISFDLSQNDIQSTKVKKTFMKNKPSLRKAIQPKSEPVSLRMNFDEIEKEIEEEKKIINDSEKEKEKEKEKELKENNNDFGELLRLYSKRRNISYQKPSIQSPRRAIPSKSSCDSSSPAPTKTVTFKDQASHKSSGAQNDNFLFTMGKDSETNSRRSRASKGSKGSRKSNMVFTLRDENSNSDVESMKLEVQSNLIDKLKMLNISIDDEENFFSPKSVISNKRGSMNLSYLVTAKRESVTHSNDNESISTISSQYNYVTNNMHNKKHISNFFERSRKKNVNLNKCK